MQARFFFGGRTSISTPERPVRYWERLIDRPDRFGKMKARFRPTGEGLPGYKGVWWCPPSVDLLEVGELWITEGIFDAIALLHNDVSAVSMMSSAPCPIDSLKALVKLRHDADKRLPLLVCRPDGHGYRSLRAAAKLGKGISKEYRAAIRAEHERLVALWKEHCPARLSSSEYWDRLGVNTGNLWLCGGIKFELNGTAYFHLGFQINEAEHLANAAAGKPTSGWIDGAVEILPSEYQAARAAKQEQKS